MLEEIARADYGFEADELIVELRGIRDEGIVPDRMRGMLVEVLELTRFSNPEKPNLPPFEPGPNGPRGHQTRLFACAVLLRAAAEPQNQGIYNSQDSTVAQCVASAKVLGEEMSEATACFLTWVLLRKESCPKPLLFALALLVLAIRLRSGRLAEPELGTIAEWALAQELLEREEFSPGPANPMPLPFSIQAGFWRPLAAELMNEAQSIRDNDVRADVELCVLLLGPGSSA